MAVIVDLKAEARAITKNQGTGSRVSRRLRKAGRIPGILYGHKIAPQPVHMDRADVWGLFKVGSPLVRLHISKADEANPTQETALVKEIQWDYLGKEVIHMDFARVDTTEKVHQVVPIELKGDAPGVSRGGMLEHIVHEVSIHCPAVMIPESILLDVSELEVDGAILAKDIKLPEGASVDIDPDQMVVHVTKKKGKAELESTDSAEESES